MSKEILKTISTILLVVFLIASLSMADRGLEADASPAWVTIRANFVISSNINDERVVFNRVSFTENGNFGIAFQTMAAGVGGHFGTVWTQQWTGFIAKEHQYRIVFVSGNNTFVTSNPAMRADLLSKGYFIIEDYTWHSVGYDRGGPNHGTGTFRLERRIYPTLPATPVSIATPGLIRGGAYTVSWGAPSSWGNGNTFQYEVQFHNGSVWSSIGTTNNPTTTISHLIPSNINTTAAQYRVRASSSNGASEWRTSNTFTVDNIAPTITAANPTGWTNQNITITPTITDNLAGISQRRWAAGSRTAAWMASNGTVFTTNFTATENGVYTIYARDNAGNETVQTVTVGNIDRSTPTAPGTGWSGGSHNTWSNTNTTVTANNQGTPGVSEFNRYQMSINGGAWTNASSYTLSTTGESTVRFRVVDNAGNLGVPTGGLVLRVDKTPPATPSRTFEGGYIPGHWTNQTVGVGLSPGNAGPSGHSRIEHRINGGSWTTGILAEVSTNGVHILEYRAFDNAGNVSTIGSVSDIRIDKIKPAAPTIKIK